MVGDALCCNYIMQVSQLTDGSFKNKQDLNPATCAFLYFFVNT